MPEASASIIGINLRNLKTLEVEQVIDVIRRTSLRSQSLKAHDVFEPRSGARTPLLVGGSRDSR